jgi:predicted  nucleic acid-binding Zn-ribbon protein
MERTCIKCNHTADAPAGDLAACPQCGVIYFKAEQAARLEATRKAQAERIAANTVVKAAAAAEQRNRLTVAALIERIAWGAAMVLALYGFAQFIFTLGAAESAPQQAAGAAMAVCWAVIPYCFARAIQAIRKS